MYYRISRPPHSVCSNSCWSHRYLNTNLVRDDLQIQIVLVAVYLIMFGVHMKKIIHYQSGDSNCVHQVVI